MINWAKSEISKLANWWGYLNADSLHLPVLKFSHLLIQDSQICSFSLCLQYLPGSHKKTPAKDLGSKAVIEKLIAQNAVRIIATHDLQIAELERKYPSYIRNFYFDIQIEGTEMKFDYELREGGVYDVWNLQSEIQL